jgi:error-prone DNA polymerase
MSYIELHCHSAYSFLDGASHPEELALRAAELGYEALALTDHEGVYGSLELAHAAKLVGVRPITGAEVTLVGGAHVTLLVESPHGYANLCRLLTAAHAHTRPKRREATSSGVLARSESASADSDLAPTRQAPDRVRTGDQSLEGSCVTTTPRARVAG